MAVLRYPTAYAYSSDDSSGNSGKILNLAHTSFRPGVETDCPPAHPTGSLLVRELGQRLSEVFECDFVPLHATAAEQPGDRSIGEYSSSAAAHANVVGCVITISSAAPSSARRPSASGPTRL